MTTSPPDPFIHWKHRRRGYYAGMVWAFAQTFLWIALELYKPGAIGTMSAIIGWSYGIPATLIVSYFGGNAAETIANRGKV